MTFVVSPYPPAFIAAVAETLRREGGFVDDPRDPGGATRYGISLRYLREADRLGLLDGDLNGDGIVDVGDIRALTREKATEIYFERFWLPYRFSDLPSVLNWKVFDLGVNLSPRQAVRLQQQALRAVGRPVGVDGRIGPETLGAVGEVVSAGEVEALLVGVRCEAAGFFRGLVVRRPELEKFLRGWLRRAYDDELGFSFSRTFRT